MGSGVGGGGCDVGLMWISSSRCSKVNLLEMDIKEKQEVQRKW